MVETAPIPPGFPPPLDVDTLPVRAPHPMEAWAAEPGTPGEQRVSRILPGGGHITATRGALETLAKEMERERAWGNTAGGERVIKHAVDIAREERQREAETEERRKASNPRAVLKAAHSLQAEAKAELDRIKPLATRARDLVRDLEGRAGEQSTLIETGEAAAAAKLIEAIAAGAQSLPLAPRTDAATAEAEATAAKLRTARAALAKLETEATAANDRLARCRAGVTRCSVSVLVDTAVEEANAIVAAPQADLDRRRTDLDALARLLTAEGRRLNGPASPSLPAMISRALYPADRQLTGTDRGMAQTDWRERYSMLCAGTVERRPR
jgi:hypothetical protein